MADGIGSSTKPIRSAISAEDGIDLTLIELLFFAYLDVLKITKQSLARVLKQLIDTGHILQVQGPRDRRQRELYPTVRGRTLALELARPQSRRINAALDASGAASRETVELFLKAMVNPETRAQIEELPANMQGGTHGE